MKACPKIELFIHTRDNEQTWSYYLVISGDFMQKLDKKGYILKCITKFLEEIQ